MKKLGEILKAERIKQKLELTDIAAKTKIGLAKLESIERSDYDALPAKVFTRGLIKSYAKQLKLDVESIISLFEEEFGDQKEEALPIVTPSTSIEPPKEENEKQAALFLFQAPKSFFLFLGFVVTAILCVFIYMTLQKINSYEKEEVSPTSELAELDDFSKEDEAPSTKLESKNQKVEKVVKKEIPVKKAEPAQKKAQESTLERIARTEIEKMKQVKKPKSAPAAVAAKKSQNLLIEAFEPVRLEIFWATAKPQVMLLKADETKKIVFSNNVKIHLSDGGVVNITHNGQDLGVPGQIRKPIELKYP